MVGAHSIDKNAGESRHVGRRTLTELDLPPTPFPDPNLPISCYFCLLPRRLSLSMKMCAQRKAGRRQRARQRFAYRPYPSHGPLRFITSRSPLLPCEKRSARGGSCCYFMSTRHVKLTGWAWIMNTGHVIPKISTTFILLSMKKMFS